MAYLLFPPLLRSKVYSLANGIARPVTMLAPLLIRIPNPMTLVVGASFLYFGFLSIIIPPNPEDMKGFNGAEEKEEKPGALRRKEEDEEQLLAKSM